MGTIFEKNKFIMNPTACSKSAMKKKLFRCECLPGFEWVPGFVRASSSTNDTDEVTTPNSDDAGICVAVDVCTTFCSPQGTRRCDAIPGTGIAACHCKVSPAMLSNPQARYRQFHEQYCPESPEIESVRKRLKRGTASAL